MTAPDVSGSALGLGRKCWRNFEVLHTVAYFAAEPAQAYRALGIRGRQGYFASRSAPMGAVPPEVCEATFYVFAPVLVRDALPRAWEVAGVEAVLAARHRGVAAALHRGLPEAGRNAEVAEAVELARVACAGLTAHGRALYAGHASLPWPQDPLLALWHAGALLREHRGDGHVAALLLAGLDPVESIVTGGIAAGTTPFMKLSRGWTEQEWAAGEARLRQRGLLAEDGTMTSTGTALRASVERQTDEAASVGWEALGVDGCARLLDLVKPLREQLLAGDIFPDWYPGRTRPA